MANAKVSQLPGWANPALSDLFLAIADPGGTPASQQGTLQQLLTLLQSVLAPLASPAFTGMPTAPTQGAGDSSTRLATTAFVAAAIANLVASAPAALDTLNELAQALGDDPNFATTITNALAGKQPLDQLLSAIAGQSMVADRYLYGDGPDSVALGVITAFARGLLDDPDAATARTTLGLLSMALLAEASAAEWRANAPNRGLSSNGVWAAMAEVALTDAATVDWDWSAGFDFAVTWGGNRSMANPSAVKVGQRCRLRAVQDATGNRVPVWGSNFAFAGGTAPSGSTAPNAEDLYHFEAIGQTRIVGQLVAKGIA